MTEQELEQMLYDCFNTGFQLGLEFALVVVDNSKDAIDILQETNPRQVYNSASVYALLKSTKKQIEIIKNDLVYTEEGFVQRQNTNNSETGEDNHNGCREET